MKHLACIVGARPNFVKMAPIIASLKDYDGIGAMLIHSGQHYDEQLSEVFFDHLRMDKPVHFMDVRADTGHEQIARASAQYAAYLSRNKVDATLVVGDVNTTLGCALASTRMRVPVIHVEAGLRSFDWSMPEEFNRVLTDQMSDLLLASEPSAVLNLQHEGRWDAKLVGNVMIDSLKRFLPPVPNSRGVFALWTMHRPDNVDDADTLEKWVKVIRTVANTLLPVIFPVHPRTQKRLESFNLWSSLRDCSAVELMPPIGYIDCITLASQAAVIITDSGGLQEEATALNVPCITLRSNTERPITITHGTNHLVGKDSALLYEHVGRAIRGGTRDATPIPQWDGRASERVAKEVDTFLNPL